jgi:hypothetical protein
VKWKMLLLTLTLLSLSVMCSAQSRYEVVNASIERCQTDIPKDIIKAIAYQESGWRQWNRDGTCFRTDHDWGVMQIHDEDVTPQQLAKAKKYTRYNIWLGVKKLEEKLEWVQDLQRRPNWPKLEKRYHLYGHTDLEMAVLAYNGMQRKKDYLKSVKMLATIKPWLKKLKPKEEYVAEEHEVRLLLPKGRPADSD